uniref:BHLH domain-containing protein n=1 Tax=Kalanchoe fedtschenkoi TaxID=63787 RepID=A0A7N0RDJ6_KALFE
MAEEYQQQQSNMCSQNWWSNTNNPSAGSGNRYESVGGGGAGDHLVDHNSVSVSGSSSSSMMFLSTGQKMPGTAPGQSLSGGDGVLVDPNLQAIGLGLSSQGVDWDQALLRGGKTDQSSFRSMLQEDHMSSSTNFQHEIQWKPGKIFAAHGEESSLNRGGFSLDQQPQFSSPNEENSTITCHNLSTGGGGYIENSPSVVYGGSPSSMFQSLLGSNNNNQSQQQQAFFDQRGMEDYSYGAPGFGMNSNESQFMPPASGFSSNSKFPQFLRSSPPSQQQHQQPSGQNQLQFSNNAPYWNASSARVVPDFRASFMPPLQQPQFPTTSTNSSFEKKPKNNVKEVNKDHSSVAKKSGGEASTKRPRNESSPSTLPPFKVKKEKMGDRITALQQLVSPFGKTDTASVLSESIEYIKILHEQVLVLTTPYMKNGAMMQQQHHHYQHLDKSSKDSKGPKQDLRSRGLCLVPLSSTFPVTHETSVDFWTPTFGGPLR